MKLLLKNAARKLKTLVLKFFESIAKQKLNSVVYQRLLKRGPGYYVKANPKPQISDYINACLEVEYPIVSAEDLREINLIVNQLGMLQCIQGRTWTMEPDENKNLNIHFPSEHNSAFARISDQSLVSTSNQNPVQQPSEIL